MKTFVYKKAKKSERVAVLENVKEVRTPVGTTDIVIHTNDGRVFVYDTIRYKTSTFQN